MSRRRIVAASPMRRSQPWCARRVALAARAWPWDPLSSRAGRRRRASTCRSSEEARQRTAAAQFSCMPKSVNRTMAVREIRQLIVLKTMPPGIGLGTRGEFSSPSESPPSTPSAEPAVSVSQRSKMASVRSRRLTPSVHTLLRGRMPKLWSTTPSVGLRRCSASRVRARRSVTRPQTACTRSRPMYSKPRSSVASLRPLTPDSRKVASAFRGIASGRLPSW
mmetsp:Transcript_83393/g.244492  ORF Transcript_83393/g.244492 Transcript_83393/m.244492 type:complete len:221 (-) Transcript_83393:59-721(-)